jgi:hypothetical protein
MDGFKVFFALLVATSLIVAAGGLIWRAITSPNLTRTRRSTYFILGSIIGMATITSVLSIVVAAPTAPFRQDPSKIITVDSLPKENLDTLSFESDLCILDLRRAYPSILDLRSLIDEHTNPGILLDMMTVTKRGPVDSIRIQYATSGSALTLRCLSRPYVVENARLPDIHDEELPITENLVIDVKSEPVGQPFQIIVEATYFNAFITPAQQSFATYAATQVPREHLSLAIIFPAGMVFSSFKGYEGHHGKAGLLPSKSGALSRYDRSTFLWDIRDPASGFVYELRWQHN